MLEIASSHNFRVKTDKKKKKKKMEKLVKVKSYCPKILLTMLKVELS